MTWFDLVLKDICSFEFQFRWNSLTYSKKSKQFPWNNVHPLRFWAIESYQDHNAPIEPTKQRFRRTWEHNLYLFHLSSYELNFKNELCDCQTPFSSIKQIFSWWNLDTNSSVRINCAQEYRFRTHNDRWQLDLRTSVNFEAPIRHPNKLLVNLNAALKIIVLPSLYPWSLSSVRSAGFPLNNLIAYCSPLICEH